MRILFIRHGEAVEADRFDGPDVQRPLTKQGKQHVSATALHIAKNYPDLRRVVTSQAVRARETAHLLARAVGAKRVEVRATLNPGASPNAMLKLLQSLKRSSWVALVGHEPDFSESVSRLVSDGALRMKLKKSGFADVEWPDRGAAVLRTLYDPRRAGSARGKK